jgi:hypothetical protein
LFSDNEKPLYVSPQLEAQERTIFWFTAQKQHPQSAVVGGMVVLIRNPAFLDPAMPADADV